MFGEMLQALDDIGEPLASEEGQGGVAQGRQGMGDRRRAHPTGVFSQGGVADTVQAVLDPPVTPTEGQQPFSIGLLARETGNGVDGLPAFLPSHHPPAMDTAHLVDPGPVQVAFQALSGFQPTLLQAPVALLDAVGDLHLCLPEALLPGGKPAGQRRRRCPPASPADWL